MLGLCVCVWGDLENELVYLKLKKFHLCVCPKDIEDVLSGIKTARCGSTFFRDLGDKGNFQLLLNFYVYI